MAEVDLGVILNGTTTSRRDSVGFNNDNVDTFSFRTITNNSNINISLTGMTGNADVRLYRDFNGDGEINGNDRLIGASAQGGSNDESINLAPSTFNSVGAGSYIVQVRPFFSRTGYDLKVAATPSPDPSPLLPAEVQVGPLTSRRTFNGTLNGSNTVDTYRFSVTSNRTFNFLTTGNSLSGVDIRLIRDNNGNREVDRFTTEEIARSANFTSNESISRFLTTGNYYLQVYSGGISNSNYTLTMS
jgi:hypothetical protein